MISDNSVVNHDGGSARAIMSIQDINEIRDFVAAFNKEVKSYVDDLTTVINSFSNEEIVESFFKSGNFGEVTKTKIEKIRDSAKKYEFSIDGIISVTDNFLNVQEELNNKGRE